MVLLGLKLGILTTLFKGFEENFFFEKRPFLF